MTSRAANRGHSVLPAYLLALAVTLGILVIWFFLTASDYVGPDNDDTMRLVEVRDFLGGQGWFDLVQPRMGLEGGVLMHWSRLVDAPIAGLIALASPLLGPDRAEAAALFVWPLLLAAAFLGVMTLAGRRFGPGLELPFTLLLSAVFVLFSFRFAPGAIDHHNVQVLLLALVALGLLVLSPMPGAGALAGLASAVALAIGAETTPAVAVGGLVAALLWIRHGAARRGFLRAYGLSLALGTGLLFLLTVPPARYGVVVCDSLSLGLYAVAAAGGFGLALATLMPGSTRALRTVTMLALITLVFATAAMMAPDCLRGPLADLDPLLKTLWLGRIGEAQSLPDILAHAPQAFGAFYLPALFAIAICMAELVGGRRSDFHLGSLLFLAVSLTVAFIQVRGALFATLFSILPIALLLARLARRHRAEPDHMGVSVLFYGAALMGLGPVWMLLAMFASNDIDSILRPLPVIRATDRPACFAEADLATLARLPAGRVMAPSEMGVHILRFTRHSVLAAPYHRNQGGLLTELHTGLAVPAEAEAFLRGAGVDYVAFCPREGETRELAAMKPDGLYARLTAGEIPAFLDPVAEPGPNLAIFAVRPAGE